MQTPPCHRYGKVAELRHIAVMAIVTQAFYFITSALASEILALPTCLQTRQANLQEEKMKKCGKCFYYRKSKKECSILGIKPHPNCKRFMEGNFEKEILNIIS
jgi:hypothetical protein